MMIIFSTVPIPGVCRNGIQSNNTKRLITKVANPMLQPVTCVMPWANTVHGLTPTPEAIRRASPIPNRTRPMIKTKADMSGGLIVNGLGELQNRSGTTLTVRNLSLCFISGNV